MKNNLMRGIRKASDFLMALQLTGAFKRDALANLQVRLPAVVIGGGLTAIDTATELLAYYPVQVEKTLERYEALVRRAGRGGACAACCDAEELAILDEFLAHGRAVRAERERAAAAGEAPDFVPLVRGVGRRHAGLPQAADRVAGLPPQPRGGDQGARGGHPLRREPRPARRSWPTSAATCAALRVRRARQRPASSCRRGRCCVAAGTSPNVTYEKEYRGTFQLDAKKRFFQGFRAERVERRRVDARRRTRAGSSRRYNDGGRADLLLRRQPPAYAGNVVKAMASAKDGYRQVAALFATRPRAAGSGGAAERATRRGRGWCDARRRAAGRRSMRSTA